MSDSTVREGGAEGEAAFSASSFSAGSAVLAALAAIREGEPDRLILIAPEQYVRAAYLAEAVAPYLHSIRAEERAKLAEVT
jgi:hypothetical protein